VTGVERAEAPRRRAERRENRVQNRRFC